MAEQPPQQDPQADAAAAPAGDAAAAAADLTRTNKIEQLFKVENETCFKCNVVVGDGACNAIVKCMARRGAPGRSQHIRIHHKSVWDKLPPARGYVRRLPQLKVEQVPDNNEQQAVVPKAETDEPAKKSHRVEMTVGEVLDFIARTAQPFSIVDDPIIRSRCRINRCAVPRLLEERVKAVMERFGKATVRQPVAFALDGGTNAGVKTLNVCAVHNGVSRVVSSVRLPAFTGEAMYIHVRDLIRTTFSGTYCVGFVTDNEAAVVLAARSLTDDIGGLQSTCACHCINLLVTNILYTWQDIQEGRQLVDKCRDSSAIKIPVEIDSRWVCAFNAANIACEKWEVLVANDVVNRDEIETIKALRNTLRPFETETRIVERDGANCFTAIGAYLRAILSHHGVATDQDFRGTFKRNIYNDSVVAAVALHPDLDVEATHDVAKIMMRSAIEACVKRVAKQRNVEVDTDDLTHEIDVLMTGNAQSLFRMRVADEQSVTQFWDEQSRDLPLLLDDAR